MHYISCFLNLLEENNWNSYYYDLCKNKSKPTEGSLQKQQKKRSAWILEEPQNRPNDLLPSIWQKVVTQTLQTKIMR